MSARHRNRDPIDTTVLVETPEHIRFRHRLAGPTQRLWAYLIDLAVRAAVLLIIAILAGIGGAFGSQGLSGLGTGVVLLVLFALEWGYFVVLEMLTEGRSIGKKVMALRVLKRNGSPIGFGDSVLRNLLRAADFLPSANALAAVVMGCDRYFRRLGDLAADTLVVSEVRAAVRAPLQITPPPTAQELQQIPRRLRVTADELDALETFLRRQDSLAPTRAAELADMVAPLFARRMRLRATDPVRFLGLLYYRATERGSPVQTRDAFVGERQARWKDLDRLLRAAALHRLPAPTISRVVQLYRIVCADLMQGRGLGCGADVTEHLDALAGRAHNALYASRPHRLGAVQQLLARGFPSSVRRNWPFVLASTMLFSVPLAVGLAGALDSSHFARAVLPAEYLEGMAEAYAEGFAAGRDTGTDSSMAGFYVYNNVGVAFRCFATGILFGTGSLFFLVYNGLVTGTAVGYVMASGFGGNILTFVCGHAPFELTAIILAGAAGLKMGYSLVQTHGRTRLGSLWAQGGELLELVLGTATMLLVAAAIEAFWSPSAVSASTKWAFSAAVSGLLLLYFLLAGRGSRAAAHGARDR